MRCFHCQKEIKIEGRISRQDSCPQCSIALHVCRNCSFHDVSAPNQCREPAAEVVRDREKANFCEFFKPNQTTTSSTNKGTTQADQARNAFDNLFKKS